MELSAPIPNHVINDTVLAAANTAISSMGIKLVHTTRTRKLNLSLLTLINTPASILDPIFESISCTLRPLGLEASTTRVNSPCSKFFLHSVPTHLRNGPQPSLPVASTINEAYPMIYICQAPRSLSKPESRASKTQSPMVFPWSVDLDSKHFGIRALWLFNTQCRLEYYLPILSDTQYRNCKTFGHYGKRCSIPPVCPICVSAHSTTSHPSLDASFKGGHKCTQPPINGAKCPHSLGHMASNPACAGGPKSGLPPISSGPP